MNDHEKYLFDLQGYIVLEDVLSASELKACNDAIDAQMDTIKRRSDEHLLSGGSSALKGEQGRGDIGHVNAQCRCLLAIDLDVEFGSRVADRFVRKDK